jgi:hypothetical protein
MSIKKSDALLPGKEKTMQTDQSRLETGYNKHTVPLL